MSTIYTQLYNESVKRLCSSFVIKSHASALCMNQRIVDFSAITGFSVIAEFPETWKYYKNIAGEYHESDTPMQVVSLDTLQTISFDKQTLLDHRATVKAYTLGSTYYEDLVRNYPTQELLIRGILYPVDIQKAIDAKEFTILRYDTTEVESNEHSLIARLQKMIDAYVDMSYVRDYQLNHNLYIHIYLASIYSQLPAMIRSIRKELCKTPEAHSFHVWNYLDSHGYLSSYREFLTREQTLWLYRNIKWVYSNTGRQDTFKELLEIVLTKRGIPLGSYSLALDNTDIELTLQPTPKLQRTALNMLTLTSEDTVLREIDYVLEKQLPLAKDNVRAFDSSLVSARRSFSRSVIPDLPTKVYESSIIDSSEQEPYLLADVLLNEWIHLASSNRYLANVTIANPSTGDLMSMNMREVFICLIYVFNRLQGLEPLVIPSMIAYQVRRIPLPTFEQLRTAAEHHRVSNTEIRQFLDDQVDIGSIISTELFYDTCFDLHQTLLRHRILYGSRHHMEERIQMELVVSKAYEDRRCVLSPEPDLTFIEFFNNRGWSIQDLQQADLELLEVDLISKGTGADTRNVRSLKEIQGALLKLMAQLGPYSSHYIQTINNSPVMVLDAGGIRLGDVGMAIANLEWLDNNITITSVAQKLKAAVTYDVAGPFEYDWDYRVIQSYDLNPVVELLPDTRILYFIDFPITTMDLLVTDDLIFDANTTTFGAIT